MDDKLRFVAAVLAAEQSIAASDSPSYRDAAALNSLPPYLV